MNKKIIRLTEQDLHRIINESVNRILNESSDIDDVVNTILNDQELLNKAITALSPRFVMFPNGTQNQQNKWRMDDFISQTPEIFKGIMSIPKRKKIVSKLFMILSERYPNYF